VTQYVLRRALWSIVTLAGILTVSFFILHLSGDPVAMLVSADATPEDVARLREALGLNRSLSVQYLDFVAKALRGDFGASFRYHLPALGVVLERIPATFQLMLAGLAVTLVIAFPLGVASGMRPGTWIDRVAQVWAAAGQATPGFFLGVMMIYLFAVYLNVLPAFGNESMSGYVMPSVVLGVYGAAPLTRLMRGALREVLARDYIRTARSKGLAESVVLLRHALRNALIPVLTVLAIQIGVLLSGSVITETVFAWPGMGRLVVQAVENHDFPVVQAAVCFIGTIILVLNLLVDICYAWLDPRIRLG
jgi:peptide/nickel transport system permease protein